MRSAALLSGLLILRATAQPTFPAGVGEKIAKIREKGVVAGGDDADKVKELTDGAAATLEESLLEAAGSKDLQQASRAPWRQRARNPAQRGTGARRAPVRAARITTPPFCQKRDRSAGGLREGTPARGQVRLRGRMPARHDRVP